MTTALTAVQPILAQVAATRSAVAGLGARIASDAASGDFGAMLTAIQEATAPLSGATGLTSDVATDASTTGLSDTPSLSQGTDGSVVVGDAERYLGVPYVWGGTSPTSGFDCSGLVQHVYGDLGVALPRTSQEQAQVGQPVDSLADAEPGDLLFFEPGTSGPGHVGIYIGDGQMIDAPHTGTTVQIQSVDPSSVCAIRRVLPDSAPGGTSVPPALDLLTTPSATPATGTASGLGVPASLAPLFLSAGATYGISPQVLAAVAKAESGFDPTATNSAGAQGLMQIMPQTAAGLGIDPLDPAQAIDGAAQILSGDLKTFGSLPLALAAYNAGAGAVEQYGGIPPYPETEAYVNQIMGWLGSPT